MQKNINKILVVIFAIVLFLPTISLAGLKLQQTYPDIAGITGDAESLNTVVSQASSNAPTNTASLIRYIFTLVSVVLIGLSTLAVIIAGVQYLSSAGKVVVHKEARTRLFRSFLGLAIVIGASLILQIIAPNLTIPKLTHIDSSSSNVILFSYPALNDLNAQTQTSGGITKEFLDKLYDEGKIKYFGSQSGDLTQNFGQLTKYQNYNVSFENFRPDFIGFFGNGKDNIKVKAFYGKDFLGTGHTYSTLGGLQDNDSVSGGVPASLKGIGGLEIEYFSLKTYPAIKSNIQYFDTIANPQAFKEAKDSPSDYPPLSLSVEGVSAGVYLYGSEQTITVQSEDQSPVVVGDVDTTDYIKTVGGKGGQRYLQFDVPNFADTAFNFNDEATQIEIKNNRQLVDKSLQDDLLVFLFQGANYKGPFRAFFEKKEKGGIPIAKLYFDSLDDDQKTSWFKDKVNLDIVVNNIELANGFAWSDNMYNIGNTAEKAKTEINKMDQQGKVFGVSSSKVFHLTTIDNNQCESVTLCNASDLRGFCLVFTPQGASNYQWMSFFLPMPWFIPIPLPDRFPEAMKDILLTTDEQKSFFKAERKSSKDVKDNTDFEDNIESIGIKGKCVVALYENSVKNLKNCFNQGSGSGVDFSDCWDGKTPGEKSMVFSEGDMVSGVGSGQIDYLNLKNYQIHSCVSLESALRLAPPRSCVSSIAVYPVTN